MTFTDFVAVPGYSLMKISCCNSSFFRIDVANIAFLRHNPIKRGRNFTNLHEILRDLAIIAKSIFQNIYPYFIISINHNMLSENMNT